jgi:hypothetical protein
MKRKMPALTQDHTLQGYAPGHDPAQDVHDKQMAGLSGA